MRAALLLAIGCGVGCTNLSYRPPADVPPSSALVAGPRVTMADARPRWERRPFDNGYELADLDALRPDPWGALRRQTEAAVGTEGGPTVGVTVRGYRVVVHDPDRLKAEQEDLHPTAKPDPGDTLGFGSLLGDVVGWVLADALFAKRYPAEVRNDGPGATCTLSAEVTLTWPNGRTRSAVVATVRNADNPTTGRKFWGDDINRAVAEAAADFGRQVRELAQTGPAG